MYTIEAKEKIQDNIIEEMINGNSLNAICKLKGYPEQKTIYNWLNKDTQFLQKYTHAREQQALFYAEKIENTITNLKASAEKSRELTDIARLEIDSYKWIASKLLPKVYGTNNNTTNVQVNVQPVTGMNIVDISDNEDNEAK